MIKLSVNLRTSYVLCNIYINVHAYMCRVNAQLCILYTMHHSCIIYVGEFVKYFNIGIIHKISLLSYRE